MQSAISIEQEIVEGLKDLPTNQQQEVLDFVEFLRHKLSSTQTKNGLSMQEIARLPIRERHQLLKQYIPGMINDFENDPAMTEFSEVDIDQWGADSATA